MKIEFLSSAKIETFRWKDGVGGGIKENKERKRGKG